MNRSFVLPKQKEKIDESRVGLNTIKILQPQTSERHQIFWSENLSFIVIGPVGWHVTLLIHHNRTIITLKSP